MTPDAPQQPPKISTGTAGFDVILDGGIDAGRARLIEGTSGAGKTTLALCFLLEGARQGDDTLLATLSGSENEPRAAAVNHGWSLNGIDTFEPAAGDGPDGEAEQSVLHPAELESGGTVRAVVDRARARNPARVVFDSLSEIRLPADSPQRFRRPVLALKRFFGQQNCTVMPLDDHSTESARGAGDFPRLVASERRAEFSGAIVGTGSAELDRMPGGGLSPGANVLLIGPVSTAVDLGCPADRIVVPRCFEAKGEEREAMAAVKTRTANHERTVRGFTAGPGGIALSAPLEGVAGVFGGAPAWGGLVLGMSDAGPG